ncbi:MAG: RelA/SpoT family protein [Christensenellales bacterium]|jgi:guanosine-3',5'-bis(diphosphate) 3'-pyrophosphohydrolase
MDDLITRVRKIYDDTALFEKAYAFSMHHHDGQQRSSGEPFFIHPVAVCNILIDLGLDIDTLIAALLHDLVEDTDVTLNDVHREFGKEVADMVDGVTKLSRIGTYTKEEQQAESLRKMFLAMAKDIRVILIKLADRMHNMRTLEYNERHKQIAKATETLEIYAPLAHRLGIYAVKAELEDLSLRYLKPDEYYELRKVLSSNRDDRYKVLNNVMDTLRDKLTEADIKAEIYGRDKHLYSIYRKMDQQGRTFDQIYDITAIRIIVESVRDCYAVLGIVHTLWKPLPNRFKDYIAVPKANMYQSLHTTLAGELGMPFEIQIRTYEMHKTAEYGIAAHWKYKEGKAKEETKPDEKLSWLRQLMEWQTEVRDPQDFMETLKLDLFSGTVFVFTPKGEVKDLSKGATPLDFAYSIHSAVGNKCVGSKVNGKLVPLDYELQSGDIVEILTSSSSRGPSRDWLKIAKTSNAKAKIRQWFKKELKEENIIKGREMLEKETKRQGFTMKQLFRPEWLEAIFKKFTIPTIEDLYAAVGYGALNTSQILTRLINEYRAVNKLEQKEKLIQEQAAQAAAAKEQHSQKPVPFSSSHGVIVKGEANMAVRFARCCAPVPGDDIVGYITRGRGVSVHRSDCNNIAALCEEPDRFIDVSWAGDEKTSSYSAHIQIIAVDRKGLLVDISRAVMELDLTLSSLSAKSSKQNSAVISMTVDIKDTKQLDKLIKHFKNLPEIIEVFRVST